MEEKGSLRIMSDDEFIKLVKLAQTQSDVEAMNAIFQYFDQDIKRLSKLLRMPNKKSFIESCFWNLPEAAYFVFASTFFSMG